MNPVWSKVCEQIERYSTERERHWEIYRHVSPFREVSEPTTEDSYPRLFSSGDWYLVWLMLGSYIVKKKPLPCCLVCFKALGAFGLSTTDSERWTLNGGVCIIPPPATLLLPSSQQLKKNRMDQSNKEQETHIMYILMQIIKKHYRFKAASLLNWQYISSLCILWGVSLTPVKCHNLVLSAYLVQHNVDGRNWILSFWQLVNADLSACAFLITC